MEFPIEIQMLINDYARPLTRPDWRKGSDSNRTYRSLNGGLNIRQFKMYLDLCSDLKRSYKLWAYDLESGNLDTLGE